MGLGFHFFCDTYYRLLVKKRVSRPAIGTRGKGQKNQPGECEFGNRFLW
jgi:hypothetical protein